MPPPTPPNASRPLSHPTYAGAFRCIGPACEDPCCGDWDIPLDRQTYELYQQFPPERLGAVVSQFVFRNAPGEPEELFAQIYRKPDGACPFYSTDRLCGIQQEYGPRALSASCSIYPRALGRVNGVLEGSLSLSCPEAARNVLLMPDSTEIQANLLSGEFRTDNVFLLASDNEHPGKPAEAFPGLRAAVIDLIRDRSAPIAQRMLRIGALCSHLTNPGLPRLSDAELDALPSNPPLKLKVVFTLSDALMRDGVSERFGNVFWTYIEGLGSDGTAPPDDDQGRFQEAERLYYQPFLGGHPHIIENYLVNFVYQHLFPYGRKGSDVFISGTIFDEYIRFCAQFAWVNALLIGVAANHKAAFGAEHVVETIQSFTRAVEHYPATVAGMVDALKTRRLDTLEGMAILLKS